jgi:hypothetical protein
VSGMPVGANMPVGRCVGTADSSLSLSLSLSLVRLGLLI